MKTEVQRLPQPKKFQPFRLIIDVETEQEARILGATYGICGTLSEALKGSGRGLDDISLAEVRGVLHGVGYGADRELLKAGIYRVAESMK